MISNTRQNCPYCNFHEVMMHRNPRNGKWFQQCHRCFKTWKADPPKFFQGEDMTCTLCGKVEKSDPNVTSNWTVIEADGQPYYCCPACLQENAGSIEGRYELLLKKIAEDRTR